MCGQGTRLLYGNWIELLKGLQERGIEFISLTEQIDTTTPGGKLIFHLMGALAEFERDLIRERTNAGLTAARARGRIGGRPRKLKTNGKVALARRMFADQSQRLCAKASGAILSQAPEHDADHGEVDPGF